MAVQSANIDLGLVFGQYSAWEQLALWWFDDTMSLLQVLGCRLILFALLLNRYKFFYGKFKSVGAGFSR